MKERGKTLWLLANTRILTNNSCLQAVLDLNANESKDTAGKQNRKFKKEEGGLFMFTVNSRTELYQMLKKFHYGKKSESDNMFASQYALVSCNGEKAYPMYFMEFEGAYFESPCEIMKTYIGDNVEGFIKDMMSMFEIHDENEEKELEAFIRMTIRDNFYYGIENFQTSPFITFPCEVVKFMSEDEVVDFLIGEENKHE